MGCLRDQTHSSSSATAPSSFHSGFFLYTTPRKVSFEDGPSSGDDSDLSESNTPSPDTLTRKRSLLKRPKSTMSLVDLAKQCEASDQEDKTREGSSVDEDEEMGEPEAKRICSPRACPVPSPRTTLPTLHTSSKSSYFCSDGDMTSSAHGETSGPSQWGQFVDMLIPQEEHNFFSSSDSFSQHLCYHELEYNQPVCSCRSRRSSPYSSYNKNSSTPTRRAMLQTNPPSTLHLQESIFTNPTATKFRLVPRKILPSTSSHDLLIGALADLNF
ncbi:hypothetical protein IV203_015142 [Nitzschia inconspicua]|uniref:Uncharacterized protein n=1 Tax=Nitzschia inconspicua TaxID=303405 RepID=A0A9K3LAR1_9STRA|nr:hypothetical protein IV203_015142 [Nitzschia inconspicua]